MKYRWQIRRVDPNIRRKIEAELGLHPLIAHLLVQRGINEPTEAMRFLNPYLDYLYPPELMRDMDKVVEIIKDACGRQHRIVIYGDYDVDGVTASAVLYETLRQMKAEVSVFIPDRIREGYGLSIEGVNRCIKEFNPELLITVDCGIRAVEEVNYLKSKGIKVIITDHHLPGEVLPSADGLLNPKISDCPYPYKDLSGVGVAYKLAKALLGDRERFLDLTALGTIADIVPLLGENRIIVKNGMRLLGEPSRPGIRALMEASHLSRLTVKTIGFVLGPRLNAAGRMASAMHAFRLLTCRDEEQARSIAKGLCIRNSDRQRVQQSILEEAIVQAQRELNLGRKVIVVASENWHPGIIGIVASRLVDKFGLPAVVISLDGEIGKGSARSIGGFDITAALCSCSEYLMEFGGHKFAAGFSIRKAVLEDFRLAINHVANAVVTDMRPAMSVDGRLRLDMLSFSLIEKMEQLSPFGEGNPRPVFLFQGLHLRSEIKSMAKETIKFWVTDGRVSMPVVGFGMIEAKRELEKAQTFDIIASPTISSFNGWQEAQLELVDWKV